MERTRQFSWNTTASICLAVIVLIGVVRPRVSLAQDTTYTSSHSHYFDHDRADGSFEWGTWLDSTNTLTYQTKSGKLWQVNLNPDSIPRLIGQPFETYDRKLPPQLSGNRERMLVMSPRPSDTIHKVFNTTDWSIAHTYKRTDSLYPSPGVLTYTGDTAYVGFRGGIERLDLRTGERQIVYVGIPHLMYAPYSISPDGRYIGARTFPNGHLGNLIDISNGEEMLDLFFDQYPGRFSADGSTIWILDESNEQIQRHRLYSVETGEVLKEIPERGKVEDLFFSSSEEWVVLVHQLKVDIWELETMTRVVSVEVDFTKAADLSPDEQYLVVAHEESSETPKLSVFRIEENTNGVRVTKTRDLAEPKHSIQSTLLSPGHPLRIESHEPQTVSVQLVDVAGREIASLSDVLLDEGPNVTPALVPPDTPTGRYFVRVTESTGSYATPVEVR